MNDDWVILKSLLIDITHSIHNDVVPAKETLTKFMGAINNIMDSEVYCPTCKSCGEEGCCPPSKCKYGLMYIGNLQKELNQTRRTLAAYIKKAGYEPTEEIIDQEIDFYGQ